MQAKTLYNWINNLKESKSDIPPHEGGGFTDLVGKNEER